MHYRSLLFVPGNRPERFEKACQSGSDLVCIDLEDAVGHKDKNAARTNTFEWLSNTTHKNVSLRINGLDTEHWETDIKALTRHNKTLPFLMIPKVHTKADLIGLDKALPKHLCSFFPIIESAKGLQNAAEIFSFHRVKFGLFGSLDYSVDMDCEQSWDAHLYARSHLANCARAEDITLFDAPHFDVSNLDDCRLSTQRSKSLGIHARAAIHPAQVTPIHQALAPTETEIENAKAIIAALEKADGNVALLNGKFIEAPVAKKAKRILGIPT